MQLMPISQKTNIVYSKFLSTPQKLPPVVNDVQKNNNIQKPHKKTTKILFLCTIALLGLVSTIASLHRKNKQSSKFVNSLTKSLNEYFNLKVKPVQLKSIISGEELLTELKTLKKENFVASPENIKNGKFLADLHSHSVFSDGKAEITTILEQVSNYANLLYQKTGKKFLYALTDHDSCEGVKEAIKLIAQNPNKFKNVKFVTGAEMSFAIKSDKTTNAFETIEALVYGFNPFSKKNTNFFKNISNKRELLAKNYIKELKERFGYADFSFEEFKNIYLDDCKYIMMNNQWKVHHYGQTKNAIAGLANFQNKDKTALYQEIMSKTKPWERTLGNLRDKELVPKSFGDDSNITTLCKEKYSPHYNGEKIDFAGENNFDEIIENFANEQGVFMAFAHPYYITERNSKALEIINELIKKSKGLLQATERHHQAYKRVNLNSVEVINKEIQKNHNLIELGGRDNHEINWLKF